MPPSEKTRCDWAGTNPLYVAYHDEEWGVPVTDDRALFEFLVLEGAQAGLSWLTILQRRDSYRRAFDGFDPERVARYTPARVRRLLADPGIIRNRAKVESAVANARAFLKVVEEHGSFSRFQWRFVNNAPVQARRKRMKDIPPTTPESEAFSRELKALGFRFVGPTIMYAHMQAVGMVNDHVLGCFRHAPVESLGRKFEP
jgi:DNA-3-methyladenine glycosylase I